MRALARASQSPVLPTCLCVHLQGHRARGRSLPPQASLGRKWWAALARAAGPGALAMPIWLGSLARLWGLQACLHWLHHNHGGHPAAGASGLSDHTSPLHLLWEGIRSPQPEEKAGWREGSGEDRGLPGLLQPRLSEPCLGGCRVLKSAGVTGSWGMRVGSDLGLVLLTSIRPVPGTYHSASHLHSCQGAALSPSLESPAAPGTRPACADPCLSPQPGGPVPLPCHMRKPRLRWGHSEEAGVPTLEPPGCPKLLALGSPDLWEEAWPCTTHSLWVLGRDAASQWRLSRAWAQRPDRPS